jgi:DNA-binding PadR family transcriptional regulator
VLRRALSERGLEVEPGSLYRCLRELERDACINSRWVEPAAGPRARVYTITLGGERCLEVLAATIELARDAQDGFLEAYREAAPAPAPD